MPPQKSGFIFEDEVYFGCVNGNPSTAGVETKTPKCTRSRQIAAFECPCCMRSSRFSMTGNKANGPCGLALPRGLLVLGHDFRERQFPSSGRLVSTLK